MVNQINSINEFDRKLAVQEVIDRIIEHGYGYMLELEELNKQFQLSGKSKTFIAHEKRSGGSHRSTAAACTV